MTENINIYQREVTTGIDPYYQYYPNPYWSVIPYTQHAQQDAPKTETYINWFPKRLTPKDYIPHA